MHTIVYIYNSIFTQLVADSAIIGTRRNDKSYMTKLEQFIFNTALFRKLAFVSKRIILPGFEGVSLYEVGRFFYLEMGNLNMNDRCSAVTYSFLTALPPTLLFLFALIPYLPLHDVEPTILNTIRLVTPNLETYNSVSRIILDFMHKEQHGLLSFSLLLAFFFSSNGMMGLMRYFDRDLKVYVQRSGLQRRWAALKLTFMLISVVLLSIAVLIIQSEMVNELILIIFGNVLMVKIFSLLIIVGIIFCAISFIYIYGPSLTHRFKFFSPGSVLATMICVLSSAVFFFMVNNFINYSKVYGSIGTLIAFFVWIRLNTQIILLGFELNVSILMGKIHSERPLVDK